MLLKAHIDRQQTRNSSPTSAALHTHLMGDLSLSRSVAPLPGTQPFPREMLCNRQQRSITYNQHNHASLSRPTVAHARLTPTHKYTRSTSHLYVNPCQLHPELGRALSPGTCRAQRPSAPAEKRAARSTRCSTSHDSSSSGR